MDLEEQEYIQEAEKREGILDDNIRLAIFFHVYVWCWGLNTEPCTCKAPFPGPYYAFFSK